MRPLLSMVRKISQRPEQRCAAFALRSLPRACTLTFLSSLALAPACTLVVGERPEREQDAGADAGREQEDDAGLDAGTREDGGANADASSANDAGAADAALADAAPDAGVMIMDGGSDSAVVDAGPAPDCGANMGTLWYPDGDGDDYGRSAEAVQTCTKPSDETWARRGGDCKDNNADVHPDQTTYFGMPYRGADGNESYDYDCSGSEEANPNQRKLASCGLLELIACSGSGYMPSARAGADVDAFCGSRNIGTCMAGALGLGCSAVPTSTDAEPFKCK